MNDREALQQIANIANAQLGTVVPPGPVIPPYVPPTQPPPSGVITVKPQPFANCGTYNGNPAQIHVNPGQVVGVDFTVLGHSYSRMLRWFGAPGQFYSVSSWAIFDSAGTRIMGEDNSSDTVDYATYLKHLGAGVYTLAVAVNGAGNLGIQWQQSPQE